MALSTTQYGYIIDPLVPLTDDTGRTISNGYVRFFMAGTSTPVITYKNFDGATNEETVQLDNSGRTAYPVIGSKGSTYKVCVYDAEHSQETPIKTIDKVVPIGASVSATNIVTGLDNVESPEAGWVKSTVSGTDAEVSLDATNVTSEVDTMVKATAASADYMMPLVHKAGSDPDKKITLGNIFKFVLDNIVNLATTITSFASGDYFVVGRSTGAVKIGKDDLLKETAQNALAGNVVPAFDPTRTSENPYKAGESVAYDGKIYTFKVDHYGAWATADVYEDGEVVNAVNSNTKHILGIQEEINEKGEFTEISASFTKLFDGFIAASTGIVYSYQTNAYQIKYKLFANDSFVKVARSAASAENANVLLVVDNIAKVFVGANVSRYIVDRGSSNPFEGTFFVPAGSYFVWGWQSGSASNTTISSADAVKLKTLVNSLGEDVAQIEQDISYYEAVENIAVNTLTLSSAYIDGSGKVKSWSNTNYNVFSYQAQTEEYVKIKRTESVYETNDVICKCNTISGISVGNYIDGEVLCKGSDYPFEIIVHLDAGQYIVRSGTSGADKSVFTKLEKKLVKDKLFPLEGLKVDFEGDSIMAGTGGGGGWPSLIAENEKVVATNNGASGYKIAGILAKVKSRTPSNYDMIVVQGGFNDGTTTLGTFDRDDYRDEGAGDYDQTTFYGAMEILCRYCLVNFSKAMFIVGYNWGNNTWNTILANACVEVCEKWGMPYVDMRIKAGFNLHVLSLREKYGVYIGDVAAYDPTAGYSLDDQAKNDGKVYKANQNISSPAGAFDASKWTYIGMEYDQCHCNEDGYKKSVGAIVEMMKSLLW